MSKTASSEILPQTGVGAQGRFSIDNTRASMIRNQLARVSKNQKSGTSGLQLPSGSFASDFVHSITDSGSPVNTVGMVDQTDSLQFKRWFGKSKVVDENGKPLVVYRGSPYDPLSQESGKGVIKPEAYFTADSEYAKRYTGNGGKVHAYYLIISRPFDIRDSECLKDLQSIYPDYEFAIVQKGRTIL